jgi:Pvc16 N-terminal domain
VQYNRRTVIDAALNFIAAEVNAHLLKRTGSELGAVAVGPIVDDRGSWVVTQDTTRLTLFQIDEERTLREQMPERTLVGGREVVLPPPLRLNLVLLFAGRFQQYDQALRTLSQILAFFQARPVFTPTDCPGMPPGLERVAIDLLSYGPEQLNQMWACLGAKHLPSVVYRLRMVVLQDVEPIGTGLPITRIETTLHGR